MADKTPEQIDAERLEALVTAFDKRIEERETARALASAEAARVETARAELVTPSKTEVPAVRISVQSKYDARGLTRADAEVAAMLMEGARQNRVVIDPSEDFKNWHRAVVLDAPTKIDVMNDEGTKRVRSVEQNDEGHSGFGQQLVGAQYVTELWAAARNEDSLVSRIREIPMQALTSYVPVDGDLPEMLLAAEQVNDDAYTTSPYAPSPLASNRATLTAKKFTIQQLWSGELNEDSIISYVPFLREQLGKSVGFHLGSAFYNGDTATAGSTNINKIDGTPSVTKHYMAFDGIRKSWLVTTTAQGKDMAGALDVAEIFRARAKLNGAANSIDAGATSPNWGRNAKDLILVCDMDTLLNLMNSNDFVTVEKYGASATVVTGELGRVYGIQVVCPAYALKTYTDGKMQALVTNNTKGQISVLNPAGFLAGGRADVAFYMERVQRTDQFLCELYIRKAFTQFNTKVVAGIFDIVV